MALAITSVILGALGALSITGVSIETNDYISDYPSLGGCPAILGALDTPTPSSSNTGTTSVFGSGSKTSSAPGIVQIGGAGSAAISNVNTWNVQ
jgi:hypothetical protein